MNRQQAMRYGKQLLELMDEEGNKVFDSLALYGKPRQEGAKLYSVGVREIKSGETLRFKTTHEVARYLRELKRHKRGGFSLSKFIHRATRH